ncbi:tetratricopeptide repeat protein [Methanococcus sp. CF]
MINSKLISIFCIFLIATLPSSHAIDVFGHEINAGLDDVAALGLGGVVVGAVAMTAGAPILLAAGVGIGGAIAVDYAYRWATGKDAEEDSGAVTGAKKTNVSDEEYLDGTYKYELLAGYRQYSEESAAEDIAETKDRLKSGIGTYPYTVSGTLSDVSVSMKGPDKIYGFSAFPVQLKFDEALTGTESSYVMIENVNVYLVDSDGVKWNEKTYSDDIKLQDIDDNPGAIEEMIINFTMKTPDPYIGKAKSQITNAPDREILEELVNAEVKKFELVVEIKGYAKLYKHETYYSEELQDYLTREEYDKTITIDTKLSTSEPSTRVRSGAYYLKGANCSLPTDYINEVTPIAYSSYSNGATSNIIGRVWASPVHCYNSSAQYRFVLIGQPDNLEPVPVTIEDDYRALVLKLRDDGIATVASETPGNFGDMSVHNGVTTSLNYLKDDSTEAFETYFLVVADVDDGIDSALPVWGIIQPVISVIDNVKYSLTDEFKEEILELIKDNSISDTDSQRITEIIKMSEDSLKEKQYIAETESEMYSDNEKASNAIANALEDYEKAQEYYEKAITTDDPEELKVYTYLAGDVYEPAGDYWKEAAEKYNLGLDDQGDGLASNAEKLENLASEYEPSLWFSAGSTLSEWWNQFKSGFGLGDVPDTVLIIIVLAVLVCGTIIVTKIL